MIYIDQHLLITCWGFAIFTIIVAANYNLHSRKHHEKHNFDSKNMLNHPQCYFYKTVLFIIQGHFQNNR